MRTPLAGWCYPLLCLLALPGRADDPSLGTRKEIQVRIEGLKAERSRLQDELRSVLPDDANLLEAPEGGLLIGLPTVLVRDIVSEALTGPLKSVQLRLENVVRVDLADTLKTRTLLGLITLGRYELSVNVQEVSATVAPRPPRLTFGSNRIAIDLPVRVESGRVKAKLNFKWDGRKVAGIVCGDLSGEHDLRARVPPVEVRLLGRFEVEARGERLRVKPVIAPVDLSFKVEPPQETWDFVEDLIESRNTVCEAALRKAGVGSRVKDLVSHGFKVRLPNTWLHPLNLPAAFRDTFEVQGERAGLAVVPTGVSITKSRIWYGANLSVKREGPAGRPGRSADGS